MPADSLNVAYSIYSESKRAHYYGSSGCMERRLRQHRTNQGAEQTKGTYDWVLVMYVCGFPAGTPGLSVAKQFETQWQHTPWTEHRSLADSANLAAYLISLWAKRAAAAGTKPLPLVLEAQV